MTEKKRPTRKKQPTMEKWQITLTAPDGHMLRKVAIMAGTTDSAMGARAISEWLRANYSDLIELYAEAFR